MKPVGLLIAAALIGAAAPAFAQGASTEPGTIEVVGHASHSVTPDLATVQVGVSTRAQTPAAALDQNSNAARAIADAAHAFGIALADIYTSNVSLSPTYRMVRDPNGGSQQQPDGYQAENAVEVRIRDLARVGEFLRKTLDGGANRITGLSFGLADPKPVTEQVRQEAVADAMRQGKLLADAAGVKLGAIRRLRLGGGATALPPMPRMQMRAVAVPVEAGNLDVAADVEMSWVIAQP